MADTNNQAPIVQMENISKSFGKVRALDDVSLYLKPGEIRALVGENGAGKTTLMNILYGMYHCDAGTIRVEDELVDQVRWSPNLSIDKGISMIHQHFTLIYNDTVLENIVMPTLKWTDFRPQWKMLRQKVEGLLEKYNFDVKLDRKVMDLSIGERQQVEILKALYQDSKIMILDEPSGVLTPKQAEGLFRFLAELRNQNFSVVLVTHKLQEVMENADTVTVLRGGRHIDTVNKSDINVQDIARMMVDREIMPTMKPARDLSDAQDVIKLSGVTVAGEHSNNLLTNVTFNIRRGEIVGVAGAAGSGQTELAETIVGLHPLQSGQIVYDDQEIGKWNIGKRCAAGIGYIPEDRHTCAIVSEMTVAENLVLSCMKKPAFSKSSVLNHKAIRENADTARVDFKVKAESSSSPIKTLSGGNQQKVVLAKILMDDPKLIVACSPTRGLDFSATQYLREKLVESAENDLGVLLFSNDLDELFELSDRILVIFQGEIMGEVNRGEIDMEALGMMIAGYQNKSEGDNNEAS